MIIQNFKELATSDKKKECLEILEAGIRAADPENIIPKYVAPNEIKIKDKTINIEEYSNVYSVAFGKAGDSMTRALNAVIPIKSGIVVIPKGSKSRIKGKKFQIFNSGHPEPDQTSVKAAKEIIKFLQNRRKEELVIFLVSGGGSSLLALPNEITLDDKIFVTKLLLKSGATIQEFNCIRKHLSKIKGGRLVENIKCHGIGLIMSDVEGDDLSSIASGTTHMDDTTFADALDIIEKYKLKKKIPIEVLQVLKNGTYEKKMETPKESKIENYVIANNKDCLIEMQRAAEKIGYAVTIIQVFGDIKDAVTKILENIPDNEKTCLVFGGRNNSKSAWERNRRKKSRISFTNFKKYSKIKKNNHCINWNRRNGWKLSFCRGHHRKYQDRAISNEGVSKE